MRPGFELVAMARNRRAACRPRKSPRRRAAARPAACAHLAPAGAVRMASRGTARRRVKQERGRVVADPHEARRLLQEAGRIAILGIKTEAQAMQPAFYVADYLQRAGFEIVPVPVYYPDATEILGERVYRRLADVPGDVDMIVVFRRGADVAKHVDDILAKAPRSVWFQLGIRNDDVAAQLAEAGIDVVQDRCTMIEHRRL
jgi:uncharacterized protein